MKKIFRYFLVITYICNFTSVEATNLNEAILILYKNNNKLKAEKSKVKESRALFAAEVFNIMPDIRYSQDIEENQTLISTTGAITTRLPTKKPSRLMLNGDISMNNLIASPASAKKSLQMQKKQFRIHEQNILLDAISSYLGVIKGDETLKAATENLEILGKSSSFVQKRFELGEVTKTDIEQSLARLSMAKSTKIQAEGNLAVSKAIYMKVFGIQPNHLDLPVNLPALPENFTEFKNIAEKNNLDIELMALNRKLHKYDIARSTNAILPSIHISYNHRHNDEYDDIVDKVQTQKIYQASLNIPLLPRGGAEYARIIKSKYAYNRATSEYMHATFELEENTLTAWENLQVTKANIESQTAAKKYSYLAMEAMRKEVEYGSRTILDLLITEADYFNANVNLIRARHDHIIAHYKILMIIGKLDKAIFENCKL